MKHAKITKEDFNSINDTDQWIDFLRKFEIDIVLSKFSEDYFDKGLEVGCASGKYSKYLAYYCKSLTAIEYDESKLTEFSNEKIVFLTGDAQDLSRFSDNEMDLIFSSNVIEHLSNLDMCLSECRRVIKEDGLIIHTVPNRTWQISTLLLYYPFAVKTVLRRTFLLSKSRMKCDKKLQRPKLDGNLRPLSETRAWKKMLLPPIHGVSKSYFAEFKNWGKKHWLKVFDKNKLDVVDVVPLPFYFGFGFNDFNVLLRLGNKLGLSSSTAFILKKR